MQGKTSDYADYLRESLMQAILGRTMNLVISPRMCVDNLVVCDASYLWESLKQEVSLACIDSVLIISRDAGYLRESMEL